MIISVVHARADPATVGCGRDRPSIGLP